MWIGRFGPDLTQSDRNCFPIKRAALCQSLFWIVNTLRPIMTFCLGPTNLTVNPRLYQTDSTEPPAPTSLYFWLSSTGFRSLGEEGAAALNFMSSCTSSQKLAHVLLWVLGKTEPLPGLLVCWQHRQKHDTIQCYCILYKAQCKYIHDSFAHINSGFRFSKPSSFWSEILCINRLQHHICVCQTL